MRLIVFVWFITLVLLMPGQSWAKSAAAEYWVPVKCQTGVVFADEKMPDLLEDATVAYYIKEYTVLGKKETTAILERATRYFPVFETHLSQAGLPEGLKYMPMVESNLLKDVVSYAGAGGLWQFMPATARFYGLTVNETIDERTDPERATEAAVKFLSDLNRQFCDWRLVLAAYNCGPGKVRRLLRQAGSNDFKDIQDQLPGQTQKYILKFIAATYVANNYQDLGLDPFASAKRVKPVTAIASLPQRTEKEVTPSADVLPEVVVPIFTWRTSGNIDWQQLIDQAATNIRKAILPFTDTTRTQPRIEPEESPLPAVPAKPDHQDDIQADRFVVFRRSSVG